MVCLGQNFSHLWAEFACDSEAQMYLFQNGLFIGLKFIHCFVEIFLYLLTFFERFLDARLDLLNIFINISYFGPLTL